MFQPHSRKRVRRRLALTGFVVILVLAVAPLGGSTAASPPLVSDTVRDWNGHALAALFNPVAPTPPVLPGAGQTPPVGIQHMAMTQLAVYDAVNSIHGGYEPYLDDLPAAEPGSSLDAAVATAAHHVLVGLGIDPVPALPQVVRDRLDMLYMVSLQQSRTVPRRTAGLPQAQLRPRRCSKSEPVTAGTVAGSVHGRIGRRRWRPTSRWSTTRSPG